MLEKIKDRHIHLNLSYLILEDPNDPNLSVFFTQDTATDI